LPNGYRDSVTRQAPAEPASQRSDPPASPGERYLPLSPDEVLVLATGGLDDEQSEQLRRFARLLRAIQHTVYRQRWESAQAAYAPFSPDTDDAEAQRTPPSAEAAHRFRAELRQVLDAANYDEVPREVLDRALGESSVFKVKLHANLDDFAELLLCRRGAFPRHDTLSRWFGLRKDEVDYLEYDRVVMYARYAEREHFTAQGRDPGELPLLPGRAFLKLFQQVPQADLEMLIPNTEVRMRTIDKLVIGVPAVASGAVVAATKLASAVAVLVLLVGAAVGLRRTSPEVDTGTMVTLVGGLAAFAAYLWRQWSKYKSRRIQFMKTLSESLYFKTLGDGPGVLFTVLEAGEQEDFKEALLAYRGLLEQPLTAEALDERVEGWLRERVSVPVDFEVTDGLRKLAALGVATPDPAASWSVLAPDQAVEALRERWRRLGDELRSGEQLDDRLAS